MKSHQISRHLKGVQNHQAFNPSNASPTYTRPQLSPLCLQVDHSIVSACYPGSFVSSILLVVAVYIHRNFTGRELINILNTLGFSDDISSASEYCILNQRWLSSAEIRTIAQYMQQKVKQASCESVTSTMYITLPRLFGFAEFTGNWELNLFCISQMIPLFHAAGYFVHVKSVHIYLHQMAHIPRIYAVFAIWEIYWEKVLYHKKNRQFLRWKCF